MISNNYYIGLCSLVADCYRTLFQIAYLLFELRQNKNEAEVNDSTIQNDLNTLIQPLPLYILFILYHTFFSL